MEEISLLSHIDLCYSLFAMSIKKYTDFSLFLDQSEHESSFPCQNRAPNNSKTWVLPESLMKDMEDAGMHQENMKLLDHA